MYSLHACNISILDDNYALGEKIDYIICNNGSNFHVNLQWKYHWVQSSNLKTR